MLRWIEGRLDMKVMIPLGGVLLVAMAVVTWIGNVRERAHVLAVSRAGGAVLATSVIGNVRLAMVTGDRDEVQASLAAIGRGTPGLEIHILDPKQVVAFTSRPGAAGAPIARVAGDEGARRAVGAALAAGDETVLEEAGGQDRWLTVVRPVIADGRCVRCHGTARKVLGVIMIRQSLTGVYREIAASTAASILVSLLGVAAMLVLAYAIVAWLVTRRLRRLIVGAERVAEGNLADGHIESESGDEIGVLDDAFNRMVASLRDIIARVSSASGHVATAAHEISAAADQLGRAAEGQASQTTQVAASTEEMSSTIIGVARNAESVSESSREANGVALKGKESVAGLTGGMDRIAAAAYAAAATIKEFEKRSAQIDGITRAIDEITHQTRILACNAAIEAARAGEHGRGFAVVADEIKSLAAMTSGSTKEIRGTIETIREESERAVESIREVAQQVLKGQDLARGARENLEAIVASADRVTGMVQQIAAATEEQSRAAEDISRNVENIATAARNSSSATGQISVATHELARQTEDMRQLVAKFDLGPGG